MKNTISSHICRYTQIPCFDVSGITSFDQQSKYGMLKQCIWRGQALPCSEIFKTFPTDQGMCCTFNMKKAEEMFQTNQYQQMISMMQDQDKNLSIDQKVNVNNNHQNWKFTENPTPQAGRNKGRYVTAIFNNVKGKEDHSY